MYCFKIFLLVCLSLLLLIKYLAMKILLNIILKTKVTLFEVLNYAGIYYLVVKFFFLLTAYKYNKFKILNYFLIIYWTF